MAIKPPRASAGRCPARSAVGRSPSPVRWPGMRCLTTSETRRSIGADNFRKTLKTHLFRNALGHLALEALRNALYKFKTYLLTYLLTSGCSSVACEVC